MPLTKMILEENQRNSKKVKKNHDLSTHRPTKVRTHDREEIIQNFSTIIREAKLVRQLMNLIHMTPHFLSHLLETRGDTDKKFLDDRHPH